VSVFPPPWPPRDTIDLATYALGVSILSLLISTTAVLINAVTFFLAERRRAERIIIKVDFGYRADYGRDRYLYPSVVEHNTIASGERCCLIGITYHGRHSLRSGAVYCEIECAGLMRVEPPAGNRTLFDGQTRYVLLAERMFSFRNITGFVIVTRSHGNQIKHVHYWHRFGVWIFGRWPWLINVINWLRINLLRDKTLKEILTTPPRPEQVEPEHEEEASGE
jgi:hypothetical protein